MKYPSLLAGALLATGAIGCGSPFDGRWLSELYQCDNSAASLEFDSDGRGSGHLFFTSNNVKVQCAMCDFTWEDVGDDQVDINWQAPSQGTTRCALENDALHCASYIGDIIYHAAD